MWFVCQPNRNRLAKDFFVRIFVISFSGYWCKCRVLKSFINSGWKRLIDGFLWKHIVVTWSHVALFKLNFFLLSSAVPDVFHFMIRVDSSLCEANRNLKTVAIFLSTRQILSSKNKRFSSVYGRQTVRPAVSSTRNFVDHQLHFFLPSTFQEWNFADENKLMNQQVADRFYFRFSQWFGRWSCDINNKNWVQRFAFVSFFVSLASANLCLLAAAMVSLLQTNLNCNCLVLKAFEWSRFVGDKRHNSMIICASCGKD